jgi:hypothetical protein
VKLPTNFKYAVKAVSNIHRQGPEQNILLFATARGGSTWVMEIIASQPGMKYYDEPFNIRRDNVQRTGLFPDWESIMPDSGDADVIVRYLNDLAAGKYRYMNPPPMRRNHRWLTNRIVFKIHELEHLIGTIAKRCNGTVLYLLRHPVPTTMSRRTFPRLDLFLRSQYYARLIGDEARRRTIHRIAETGSHLQRGVVSWCYENIVPLRFPDFEGLFVTYEELVLNPERAATLLAERLSLPDREALLRTFSQPSTNINMSSKQTRSLMAESDHRQRRRHLVEKWVASITPRDEAHVTEIMEMFGLEIYRGDRPLAASSYLHFQDTPALASDTGARNPVA